MHATFSDERAQLPLVCVMGAGTWGTVIAHICAPCARVNLYSVTGRNVEVLREGRRHPKLPGFILDPRVEVCSAPGKELKDASVVVLAVASRYVRKTAAGLAPLLTENPVVCIAAKGLEEGSGKTLTEVVSKELPQADLCVLSGGSHAEEVANNLPFGVCLAGSARARGAMVSALAKARVRIAERDDVEARALPRGSPWATTSGRVFSRTPLPKRAALWVRTHRTFSPTAPSGTFWRRP